ncbi:MAG: methyltransferase family protein [Acholeplasmataceae bacterium]
MLSFFFVNTWPYYLFYFVTILWISEFFIFPSHLQKQTKEEKKSFFFILQFILFIILLNFIFGVFQIGSIQDQNTREIFNYVAITLYSIGCILRYISIMHLGRFFTRNVAVSQRHELVSTGPYKILRHPLYLGLFLLSTSIPLFFSNIILTPLSYVFMGYILNHRMVLEEHILETQLGTRYKEWKRARYKFIPFIY